MDRTQFRAGETEKVAEPPKAEEPKPNEILTAEEFLTKAPLFVIQRVEGFYPPSSISFECDGDCGKETTWSRVYTPQTLVPELVPDHSIHSVAYTCFRCNKTCLTVVYREMKFEKRVAKQKVPTGINRATAPPSTVNVLVGVLKLGQYPAPSITLPKALEKNLGKDAADLYRKALISRNGGYGLGAAVYIRRVVEDKTNELIEVAAQLAESHHIDPATVAKMRAVASSKDYSPYEDKLQIVATVFPDSLKVGSINPLKTLYGLVSKGIHGLSEPECIEVADQTAEVFDYIFTNLKAEVTDRKIFLERVKKLS